MPQKINANCLYVNGDSWVYGSELVNPEYLNITNHFDPIHDQYRRTHHWPRLVADSLAIDLINGSEAGSGNDRILRTSIYDLSKLKADGLNPIAVISWSQLQRFELCNQGQQHFRSFVGPKEPDLPSCVKDIWAEWSSDYCDVLKWVTQLISLHSFCQVNNIPIIGFNVFKTPYYLLEQHIHTNEFRPYTHQLAKTCQLAKQQYQFSFESVLRQHTDIEYGPGGHPLKRGQEVLAEHIEKIIRQQFTIT